ncbi:hypothetical protein ABT120_04210 [Nonomuraea angiospora]|uniref:hypothetical protein n=1 Tax=Nonomuraea angiospora TaxID=46172 RepID=UPI0033268760
MAGLAPGLARTMFRVRDIGRSTLQPPLFLETDPAVEEPGFDPTFAGARRFLLKPRTGGRSVALTPAGGDLVVMGGRCQRDWRHCVPKQTAPAGVRISVNFSSRLQATRMTYI